MMIYLVLKQVNILFTLFRFIIYISNTSAYSDESIEQSSHSSSEGYHKDYSEEARNSADELKLENRLKKQENYFNKILKLPHLKHLDISNSKIPHILSSNKKSILSSNTKSTHDTILTENGTGSTIGSLEVAKNLIELNFSHNNILDTEDLNILSKMTILNSEFKKMCLLQIYNWT